MRSDEVSQLIKALQAIPLHRTDLRKMYAEKLIGLDPNIKLGWQHLIRALQDDAKQPEVQVLSRQLLARFPNDPGILYEFAMSYFHQGGANYLPALLLLKEVVRLDPFFTIALYWIGEIYQINWEAAKSIPWFTQCLLIDPTWAAAMSRLAVAKSRVGEFDRARELAEFALQQDPDNSTTLVNSGMAYLYIGDPDYAFPIFQRALEVNPLDMYAVKQYETCFRESMDKAQREQSGQRYKPLALRLKGTHRFFDEVKLTEVDVADIMEKIQMNQEIQVEPFGFHPNDD
jgi:tetratricopeptide (TPR) repeat protein